ncbi:hypothetical protein VMCG_03501 [Cytospora schulzeri]|uniref:U3 small nucleolar RNA-associated protein 11 n=1 Tax=Cytospora schulzeri TaxID=448051 RepID=A0A423WWK9_9PEZI|nr:hypothetical protein VMCG_03501 [Valsa malicola]
MSSMRNAIQRRSHRERGQLKEREKFGLLEKNKDYKLRAKDHKKKQTVLKSLKQKASERNEDEFYFGMMSRGFSSGKFAGGKKWTGTVAGDRGNKALDIDTVRLLKTQDLGYLRTMRNVVAKEVTELEQKVAIAAAFAGADADEDDEELGGFDSEEDEAPRKAKSQPKSKKIVFAESAEELEEKLPEPEDDDEDEDMDSDFENFDDEKSPEEKKRAQNAERLRRKLKHAKKKLKTLTDAETELEMQRSRMAKTPTVGGVTKKGKTFKVRERKR